MTCPKCGGDSGYEFSKTTRHIYHGDWLAPKEKRNGQAVFKEECVSDVGLYSDKTVVCHDCGKRIKRKEL